MNTQDDVVNGTHIATTEQQSNSPIAKKPRKKAPSRGGYRPGAGRKPGAIQKMSGRELLNEIERTLGIPFATQIALNYQQALYGDDSKLKLEYDKLILSKVVADKVDITSDGQRITSPIINITFEEIPDFIDAKTV